MSAVYVACVCDDGTHAAVDWWGRSYERAATAVAARQAARKFHPDAHLVAFTSTVLP